MKSEHDCTRCGKPLKTGTEIWLELNMYTGRYSEPGSVPENESQGGFPFGADCAERANRPHAPRTSRKAAK